MSRVRRTIKLLVSVFILLITVLLFPSLKSMSHAWSPIVIQKTAKETFGEVPVTGKVFYSHQVCRSQTHHPCSRWPAQLQWKAHQRTPMQLY